MTIEGRGGGKVERGNMEERRGGKLGSRWIEDGIMETKGELSERSNGNETKEKE